MSSQNPDQLTLFSKARQVTVRFPARIIKAAMPMIRIEVSGTKSQLFAEKSLTEFYQQNPTATPVSFTDVPTIITLHPEMARVSYTSPDGKERKWKDNEYAQIMLSWLIANGGYRYNVRETTYTMDAV